MSSSDTTLDRLSMTARQDPSREYVPISIRQYYQPSSRITFSSTDVDGGGRSHLVHSRPINTRVTKRSSATPHTPPPPPPPPPLPPLGHHPFGRPISAPMSSGSEASEQAEPPIVFWPPDVNWQKIKAKLFGIAVRRAHFFASSVRHSFPTDTPPKTCEVVAGDGNCLFRAISFWIAGSEDYHLEVRELIVQEINDNSRLYSAVTSNQDIANYLRESQMAEEGIWGSEVEIFVAATLLQTPIAVFAAFGDRYLWQVFKPLRYTEPRERCMLYLQNSNNHFEPVTDV